MTTFVELPLSSALQEKLEAAQFTQLTPIQERAIEPALQGKDVIGTAQTGTGKTLAFLIPLIEMMNIEMLNQEATRGPKALVLLPTRELAMQVAEQYEQIRGTRLKKAALIVGGLSEKTQIQALRAGSSLVIATPGRLQDLITRNLVNLREIKILVLDEADRMLDMGFLPAIQRILAILPTKRQTLCFSATMEQSVAALVNGYTKQPVRIALGSVLKPAASVQLKAYEVRPKEKMEALLDLNEADGPIFKIRSDPRLTRVGRIIRRFSLDELPQLLNVVRGEMSLVGPRPPIPAEVERYEEWHRRRLDVVPGITGLWQVSGRSNLGFDECVRLDLQYIAHWSLATDLRILWRTLPAVFTGRGAY